MPRDRKHPATGISHDSKFWSRLLDVSERVAVYFPSNTAETLTVVGYYDSVSEANTAARLNAKSNGALPTVTINWWHSTISTIQVGAIRHPDAREDLPSWIDADPL